MELLLEGCSPPAERKTAKDRSSVKVLECMLYKTADQSDQNSCDIRQQNLQFKTRTPDDTRTTGPQEHALKNTANSGLAGLKGIKNSYLGVLGVNQSHQILSTNQAKEMPQAKHIRANSGPCPSRQTRWLPHSHPQGAREHYVITVPALRWRDQKFSVKCLSLSKVFLYLLSDSLLRILLLMQRNILSPNEEKSLSAYRQKKNSLFFYLSIHL